MNYPHYNTKNHTPWAGDPGPSKDPHLRSLHSENGEYCDFKWRRDM